MEARTWLSKKPMQKGRHLWQLTEHVVPFGQDTAVCHTFPGNGVWIDVQNAEFLDFLLESQQAAQPCTAEGPAMAGNKKLCSRSLASCSRSLARSLLSEQIWILFLMTQAKLFEPRVHGGLKLPLPVLVHRTESIPNPLGRGAVPERATHGTSPRSAVRRGPGVMPTRRLP